MMSKQHEHCLKLVRTQGWMRNDPSSSEQPRSTSRQVSQYHCIVITITWSIAVAKNAEMVKLLWEYGGSIDQVRLPSAMT
jgi:hypothetical protein